MDSFIHTFLIGIGTFVACFMVFIIAMLRDEIFKSSREDYINKLFRCKRYKNGFLELSEEALHDPKHCKFCIEYGKWKKDRISKRG